jgi:hypothetical protein
MRAGRWFSAALIYWLSLYESYLDGVAFRQLSPYDGILDNYLFGICYACWQGEDVADIARDSDRQLRQETR